MKALQTILREADDMAGEEYEYFADQERTGEISRATYYRACKSAGLTRQEADETLRENYQRAGLGHLI